MSKIPQQNNVMHIVQVLKANDRHGVNSDTTLPPEREKERARENAREQEKQRTGRGLGAGCSPYSPRQLLHAPRKSLRPLYLLLQGYLAHKKMPNPLGPL